MENLELKEMSYFAIAPALRSMPLSSPFSLNEFTPPRGPSLHPPTKTPSIQMAGTDVRPVSLLNSARKPGPSGIASSSRTVYDAPWESSSALALMQKGQVVKESITTGSSEISPSSFAFVATTS